MRHSHTGLSIPDFPAAYGGVLPPLDAASVARINETRVGTQAAPPITAGLILLQYVHRGWAVLIVVGLISVATAILRQWPASRTGPFGGQSSGSLSWLSSLPSVPGPSGATKQRMSQLPMSLSAL